MLKSNKFLRRVLLLSMLLTLLFSLSSCGFISGLIGEKECAHEYTESTVDSTCVAEGSREFTCSLCGDNYSETIAAKGHSYTESVIASTCGEEGYTLHTCSACGDSYSDNKLAVLEHNYESVDSIANCFEEGYTTHTCTLCNDS